MNDYSLYFYRRNVYKCMYKGKLHVVKKIAIGHESYTFKSVQAELSILSQVNHPRVVKMIRLVLAAEPNF